MKRKIQSTFWACIALMCALVTSCTDEALMEASHKYNGKPFELKVSTMESNSRLALGQDGLTTQWEPGDKLVLVDKTRTLAPIFLTCTLEEPASSATFIAESGVPAGDYFVIYNYNENLVYGHKFFQSVDDINSNDDLVLWNELNIAEGVDNASISLKHLYAKIRVELKNAIGDSFSIGMYSSKKGFPIYKMFTANGLVDAEYGINPNSMNYSSNYAYFSSNRRFHNIPFGSYNPETVGEPDNMTADYSKASSFSALVLPSDLSEEDIFFYAISGNTCYEFKKSGVEFKAGTSYKVVLDLADSNVNVSTLATTYDNFNYQEIYHISNVLDWRHAAYKHARYDSYNVSSSVIYKLTNDIDFSDEYFFPIATSAILGEGKTISNIELDWSDEDCVGLVRFEWSGRDEGRGLSNMILKHHSTDVSDLTLENVTFKGNNHVGAFGGYNIYANNCEVTGNSIIVGQGSYVGGIVGFNVFNSSRNFEDIRIGQSSSISGKNYVGGIIGQYAMADTWGGSYSLSSSHLLMESCKMEGSVSANDYVGGIFGKIGGNYYSGNSSTWVEFSMEDYTFSLIKCVNEGTVTGRHYVGGIGGEFAMMLNGSSTTMDRIVLSQSCSTGDVNGETKVGGILGSTMAATNICYSMGNISASTSIAGGIVGEMLYNYNGSSQPRIANCYSLAKISVGNDGHAGGIVGTSGMGATITNCYYAADPDVYSFGGIIGNSDGATIVSNCLTTLNSLGKNLGDHIFSTGADQDGDGYPDWDNNGDGKYDNDDLYYNYADNVTNSLAAVTSILDNILVINGDNAYSTSYWPLDTYPWYCVKFASFSADTDSPDFDTEVIP